MSDIMIDQLITTLVLVLFLIIASYLTLVFAESEPNVEYIENDEEKSKEIESKEEKLDEKTLELLRLYPEFFWDAENKIIRFREVA